MRHYFNLSFNKHFHVSYFPNQKPIFFLPSYPDILILSSNHFIVLDLPLQCIAHSVQVMGKYLTLLFHTPKYTLFPSQIVLCYPRSYHLEISDARPPFQDCCHTFVTEYNSAFPVFLESALIL